MSFRIKDKVTGNEIFIKSNGFGVEDTITIGDNIITLKDFLFIAYYVLTNTDLRENDFRFKFLEAMKETKIIDGWNKHIKPNSKRLEMPSEIFF